MTESPEIGDRAADRPQPQHAPTSLEQLADQKAKDGGSTQPPTEGGAQVVKKTTGRQAKRGKRPQLPAKECPDCHKQFMPSGMNQKRCDPCKAKAKPPKKVKEPKAPQTQKPAAAHKSPTIPIKSHNDPAALTNYRPGPSHDALGLTLVIHVNRDGDAYCARIGGDLRASFSGCGDTILKAVEGALDEFRASI